MRLADARKKSISATSDEGAVGVIFDYLTKQSTNARRSEETVAAAFAKHLWKGAGAASDTLIAHVRDAIVELGQRWYSKHVFSPPNLLRLMDLHGGTISMQAIDLLRSLETEGKVYARNTILPSSSSIGRCAKICEDFAAMNIPYDEGTVATTGGEFIEFRFDELLVAAIDAFGLSEIAKQRSVSMHVSIDGAQLTNNITHIMFGFKVSDVEARCPFTGRSLFLDGSPQMIQSRNLCIPVKMMLHKETSLIYDDFRLLFEIAKKYGEPFLATDTHALKRMGYKPLQIAINCDMSAMWKLLGVGGAAKVKDQPCHCCAIRSSDLLYVQDKDNCPWCKTLHDGTERWVDWKCYHQPMLTENNLEALKEKSERLKHSLNIGTGKEKDIEKLRLATSISTNDDPRVSSGTSREDNKSIHFDFRATKISSKDRDDYNTMLVRDLILRSLPLVGTTKERQKRLREALIQEWTLAHLLSSLKHFDKRKETCAAILLIEAVPCILHLENRVGIKIFTMLLVEGLGNAKTGKFLGTETSAVKRVEIYFDTVEQFCNQTVWGTIECPGQWKCPREGTNQDQIGEVSIENGRTRLVIQGLSGLVDLVIPDPIRKALWNTSISNNYVPSMELLRKKENFTDDDIASFQYFVDIFYQSWVELHGKAGVTNYIHMLSSGHISEYLRHWRNLYQHSQQGWESLNSMVKVFFFRRTQRGGKGRGNGKKSKLLPLARWLSRRQIWALGIQWDDIVEVVSTVLDDNMDIDEDDLLNYNVVDN